MAWTLEPINLGIGAGIALIVWLVFDLVIKKKRKEPGTSLPQMKKMAVDAHNHCVDSANNMIKLIEVFNEIEEKQ